MGLLLSKDGYCANAVSLSDFLAIPYNSESDFLVQMVWYSLKNVTRLVSLYLPFHFPQLLGSLACFQTFTLGLGSHIYTPTQLLLHGASLVGNRA